MEDNQVRVFYNGARPAMQESGMVFELASSAVRADGGIDWESKTSMRRKSTCILCTGSAIDSDEEDVYYKECNLMPRENSGHMTVSFADGIHVSGQRERL
ncbi:MAG: hypothetical protein ACLTKE_01900 [Coprococcus sp.]